MKKLSINFILAFIICLCIFIDNSAFASIVWEHDMTNLTGWTENSGAASEAGESTGGIQVSGDLVQMNSWWDSALWMNIEANSGLVIQDEMIYTLEVHMQSYNSGAAVTTRMTNVTDGGSTIEEASHSPSSMTVQPYTISFTTVGSVNDSAVGDTLGVVVDAGWWNNMGVTHVSIDEDTSHFIAFGSTPENDIQPSDNIDEVGCKGDSGVDVQLSWNTMLDISDPCQPEPDVTKHYLYLKENSSDFTGVTPIEIPAGSPVDPVASYLAEDLNYSSIYYWRVDESINNSVPTSPSTVTGPVWAFETTPVPTDNDVTIDKGITYQTFEGFGVGTMDQQIPYWYTIWTTAKLNEYLDKMYTLDDNGLGLEITRVPMPVGDDLSHTHMWAYSNQGFRSPEAIETSSGVFDLSGHEDILWHIQGAEARGVKMWAYWHSVPLWLTISGCTAGHTDGSQNNLQAGQEARFAEHMCDIIELFRDSWSVDFDYIGAINEPDEDWWDCWNEGTSSWAGNQPGCHVSSSQAVTIHQELQNEMDLRGLTQKMVAPDSFSSADDHNLTYLDTLLTAAVGPDIDVISCHQYYVTDDGMAKWYWRSVDYSKSLWMSEWGDWNNIAYDQAEVLAQSRDYANKIQQGLKDLNTTGYIFWESDLLLDAIETDFDVRKSYWVAAQFTRHVRSGMQLLHSNDDNSNCKTTVWLEADDNPTGRKLVIVTVNNGSSPILVNYDLSPFRGVKIDEVRRTSDREDYAEVAFTQTSDFEFLAYGPAYSVVTVSGTIQNCKDMQGDLTDDCLVNMDDLKVVAGNWLDSETSPCSPLTGDTNNDCSVDLTDQTKISTDWLDIKAFNPDPADSQTSVNAKGRLSWGDNYHAVSYDVYIGTNLNDVQTATRLSTEYQGNTIQASYPFDLGTNQTYYWRVDSEDSLGVFKAGDLWSFATGSVATDPDLVGWWKLDESSGLAQDSSTSGNIGYLYGNPQWEPTQGKINGAIDLDGSGDYVAVPGFDLTTNNVTVTAWINGWKAVDWAGIIYSRSTQATGMHFGGGSELHYTWNYDDSSTWNWSGGPTIPQDQWALIAMVIEPDKATLYVYSDGNGLQNAVNSINHVPQTIDDLKFGYDDVGSTRYFNGLVDDVRVYKRALTEQEILNLVP